MRLLGVACVLALVASGCTADNAFYNCGDPGGTCCADDTCKSGSVCNGASCQQCGGAGQACCAGRQCSGGQACTNDVCAACGGAGQACCTGNECGSGCCVSQICAASGATCPQVGGACANGSCGTCGAVGQPCCVQAGGGGPGRMVCTGAGAACVGGQCVACGSAGQTCCSERTCIQQGYACGRGDANICQQCGGAGQVCCAGSSCTASGLACSDGICAVCGGPGQVCCVGAACASGGCCNPAKVTCVADGATCSGGGVCAAAVCPPAMSNACGGGKPFATFIKACANTQSCSIGVHQTDCCGSQSAIGINHSELAAFTAAETLWDGTCPQCGCAAMPTRAEDGKTCDRQMITVTCDNGMCRTRCN